MDTYSRYAMHNMQLYIPIPTYVRIVYTHATTLSYTYLVYIATYVYIIYFMDVCPLLLATYNYYYYYYY